jgi:hypothetical protein
MKRFTMRKLNLIILQADNDELLILSILLKVDLESLVGEEARSKIQEVISQRGEEAIRSFGITLDSNTSSAHKQV